MNLRNSISLLLLFITFVHPFTYTMETTEEINRRLGVEQEPQEGPVNNQESELQQTPPNAETLDNTNTNQPPQISPDTPNQRWITKQNIITGVIIVGVVTGVGWAAWPIIGAKLSAMAASVKASAVALEAAATAGGGATATDAAVVGAAKGAGYGLTRGLNYAHTHLKTALFGDEESKKNKLPHNHYQNVYRASGPSAGSDYSNTSHTQSSPQNSGSASAPATSGGQSTATSNSTTSHSNSNQTSVKAGIAIGAASTTVGGCITFTLKEAYDRRNDRIRTEAAHQPQPPQEQNPNREAERMRQLRGRINRARAREEAAMREEETKQENEYN